MKIQEISGMFEGISRLEKSEIIKRIKDYAEKGDVRVDLSSENLDNAKIGRLREILLAMRLLNNE